MLAELYRPTLGLLADLYQFSMAQAYWKDGTAGHNAVFHLTFRSHPFHGGYTVVAGLAQAIEWLERLRFDEDDLAYLGRLTGADTRPLFEREFLRFLGGFESALDVDAVPEGRVVFPHEPLLRVRGPLWQGQLVETALLTIVNFQSLIATKAARICHAAGTGAVVDFGLRRAQGIDGSISAARAAYIGGVAATSNVLAGRLLGIPVRGTHAHSWVMSHRSEQEAFDAYAAAMPNNTLLLVDTYDTLEGVRAAIRTGLALKERGGKMLGIRLDSGDLAYLSKKARAMLDEAGLNEASIVASNDLDEQTIESLRSQGARIDVWGVGTRLITGHDQPALGGVYKLGAIAEPGGEWRRVIKASEQLVKSSVPGMIGVRRFTNDNKFEGDMIYDELAKAAPGAPTIVHPGDATRRRSFKGTAEELLVPVLRGGRQVAQLPRLSDIRATRERDLEMLDESCRRRLNPHEYPAGLDVPLHEMRTQMAIEAKNPTSSTEVTS